MSRNEKGEKVAKSHLVAWMYTWRRLLQTTKPNLLNTDKENQLTNNAHILILNIQLSF